MTLNSDLQVMKRENKQKLRSAVMFIIGAALGAIAYLLITKIILDQTYLSCAPGFFRGGLDASKFSVFMLVGPLMSDKALFYRSTQYVLASIPYAILGALIAVGSKRVVILVVALLIFLRQCSLLVLWLAF